MSISKRTYRRLLTWLGFLVFGAVAGALYVQVMYLQTSPENTIWSGVRAGALVAGSVSFFELFVLDGAFGRWLRRKAFLPRLGIRFGIHAALIFSMLVLNVAAGRFFGEPWAIEDKQDLEFGIDMIYSFGVLAVMIFVMQVNALIGARTLRNFVIGRYHQPVAEQRLFLLLDVVASTPAAGRLGDARFHSYLSEIFFDIDHPITENDGEVYTYVGDAVIATWPLDSGESRVQAIRAMVGARQRLSRRRKAYQAKYGEVPRLRAVLHGGTVVAGECGDSHRQVTYLGDVLNTLARLEALGKLIGADSLVSSVVLEDVKLPRRFTAEDLGAQTLRGVAKPVQVFAITERDVKPDILPDAAAAGAVDATAG